MVFNRFKLDIYYDGAHCTQDAKLASVSVQCTSQHCTVYSGVNNILAQLPVSLQQCQFTALNIKTLPHTQLSPSVETSEVISNEDFCEVM